MNQGSMVVKFGTDGWRGIIADDFTYENVRVAAGAIAHYVLEREDAARGICVGWDTRFGSRAFAGVVADVLSQAGIPVKLASGVTPTPALSYGVRQRGAAGGVMITSSHNPPEWNGVKYKASYGGSGLPSIMAAIESQLGRELPKALEPAGVEVVDFNPPYIAAIANFVDLAAIRASGYRFLIDSMYGAGRGILHGIFQRAGVPSVEIRSELNPAFPGINPEPILPHIRAAQEAVVSERCDAGLITDGDADRIGAVDEHGNVVDAHKILSLLTWWLLERKQWPGEVTRAFNTTKMVDRIAAKYGREVNEHGIGFKYVAELMLQRQILIGGEESGGIGISRHLPERDGLLNSLLIANVMADEKKTLGELVAMLQAEFGEHHYGRIDMHISEDLKQSAIRRARAITAGCPLAGMKVLRVETMDGIKFFLDNPACAAQNAAETWLLLRASGTEPLLRVYSESCTPDSVERILAAAKSFVLAREAMSPGAASFSGTEIRVGTNGLLFDMDGVLVSSIGAVNRCWRVWCERNEVSNPESFEVPHGTRAIDIVRLLKPEWNEQEVAVGLREIEDLEIADTADLVVLPGVEELLRNLPPERWAIVTSATRRLLLARLETAGLPVPARLISGDMVERGKPDPEPYRRGAELLGLAPAECVVVEDAPSGVGAGVAAACRVLGVLGTHTARELAGATWCVVSLEQLQVETTGEGLVLRFPTA